MKHIFSLGRHLLHVFLLFFFAINTVSGSETKNVEALIAASAQNINSGQYEKAIVQLNDAAKIEPQRALIFGLKAEALIQLGKFKEAEDQAKKAIKLGDDSGMIQVTLAKAHLNNGKLDQALTALQKAKSLKEDSVDFHFIHGLVLTEKGSGEAAFDAFMNAVAKRPELEKTVKEVVSSRPDLFRFLLKE